MVAQPEVAVQPIRDEQRVALLPRRHPLSDRDQLRVSEVLDETFLGYHPTIDAVWAGFWSLDDHRGGPAADVTADQILSSNEMLAAISSRDAITTVPACHAEAIANFLVGVVAIPLADARPARLSLVSARSTRNPGVKALVAAAGASSAESASGGAATPFADPLAPRGQSDPA